MNPKKPQLSYTGILLAVLLLCSACRSECAQWCQAWSNCQNTAAEKAGLKHIERQCTSHCEQSIRTPKGQQALETQLKCLNSDCSKMVKCIAKQDRNTL
ncbi:MAG TPA: hypothetical protein EYN66_00655 [Myxococcales bacterium]|nr:hypothetical protein [Myxococcales bacterium]